MRIIRNDDHDDHEHDDEPRDPRVLGEILADEVSDFLAAAAHAVDRAPFSKSQDAPTSPPTKPDLRLVKTDDTTGPSAVVGPGAGLRPRLLRTGLGGSLLVLTAVTPFAWGQPAVVAVPIAGYGLGWIAYLWWNATLRPPITQAAITVITAFGRAVAALARGFFHTLHRGANRIDTARTRHESTRTATT